MFHYSITFRGMSIRLFMAGDYELLCRIYGTSGATGTWNSTTIWLNIYYYIGRHCCLWCHIKQQDLKLAPTTPHEGRSLATLTRAHSDFVSKGKSDHSKVKEYFNVLAPPILVIPLDQVITINRMWLLPLNP